MFFTRLRALKTAAARGHLYAGARFGARRRAGAAEEVRSGVRRATGGARTPENGAEPTGKLPQRNLRVDSGESLRPKEAVRGQAAKSMRRSSPRDLDGRYRR